MRKLFALLCFMLLLSRPVRADSTPRWLQVQTEHFTVITDGSDAQARSISAQFERMHALFAKLLPHAQADSGSSVVVLALKNRKGFQALEPEAYLGKNALDLAGYFLPRQDRSYILLRLDTSGEHPYATVYHEYTHYMTRHITALPLWLNEGLAEFYQNTDIDNKTARLGQPDFNEIRFLGEQRLLPLSTLFAVDHNSPFYHEENKGNIFYAESWALTHMLFIQDFKNHTQRIQSYLLNILNGQDSIYAAEHAFGDLKVLQKTLDDYVHQNSYNLFTMPLQNTVAESSLHVEPLATPDANAIRADLLMENGRKNDARALIDSVLKDAPENAQVHESMGMMELRQGNVREARKWYGEAVALHAASYLAYYNFGALSLQLGNGDGATEETVGASLRKAVELNPHFAPADEALANFDQRHEQLDEALEMITRAVELDPGNVAYRLDAAQIRVQRKEFSNAIAVLQSATKVAKTPEEQERVKARLESMERFQQQRAEAQTMQAGETQPEAALRNAAGASTGPAPQELNQGATITDSEGRVLHPVILPSAEHIYPPGPPDGPKHTVKGVLRSVSCFYPKGITLSVDGSGKAVPLYSNDMYGIQYSAANFTPGKDLNPCQEFEGMKASVTYAEVKNQPVAGQIVAVELSK